MWIFINPVLTGIIEIVITLVSSAIIVNIIKNRYNEKIISPIITWGFCILFFLLPMGMIYVGEIPKDMVDIFGIVETVEGTINFTENYYVLNVTPPAGFFPEPTITPDLIPTSPRNSISTITLTPTPSIIQTSLPTIENSIDINMSNLTGISSYLETREYRYIYNRSRFMVCLTLDRRIHEQLSIRNIKVFEDHEYDSYFMFLDEPLQKSILDGLVTMFSNISPNLDICALHAIRFVQSIPYDNTTRTKATKFPYSVLYLNTGDCDEKSALLAYILRGMGYSVSYLYFPNEHHLTLGVACEDKYRYNFTKCCFVETTVPLMVTYSNSTYGFSNSTLSNVDVFPISSGNILKNIDEEYLDAKMYDYYINSNNLYTDDYDAIVNLMGKYGIKYRN